MAEAQWKGHHILEGGLEHKQWLQLKQLQKEVLQVNRCKGKKNRQVRWRTRRAKCYQNKTCKTKRQNNKKTYPERKQKQRKVVASNNGRKKIKVEEKEKYR